MHADSSPHEPPAALSAGAPAACIVPSWSDRYGERHRLQRISQFPEGIDGPKKVRIYRRSGHFVLQVWDPQTKATLCDRVDGDLVAAITRAREIDERLEHFKRAGGGHRNIKHAVLVEQFVHDLQKRANAGEITPGTAKRYASALGHYLAFLNLPQVAKAFPFAGSVDREFQLAFVSFLVQRHVAPNGRANTPRRPLRSQPFILDAARSLFEWAADPDRGNLLPQGFRNPFARSARNQRAVKADQFGEPDITVEMAVDFIKRCDAYQLPLFGLMIMCGLRAAEPILLFREQIDNQWIKVQCVPALVYTTKGRRDKRFPLVSPIGELIRPIVLQRPEGLLFTRRHVLDGSDAAPLDGASLEKLIREFEDRCATERIATAAGREQVRDDVVRGAGGLTYDLIEAEFQAVRRELDWPAKATLKDFRHLFSTCLENAGMPEYYRRYMMGQSPGKAAIVTYTHLNELKKRYEEAIEREFRPLVGSILSRAGDVGLKQG